MNLSLKLTRYMKRAILGGVIALGVLSVGAYIIGHVSGYEAKVLLQKSLSGINVLSNTIILASATILALLLTVLGLSSNINNKLKKAHYHHILLVAKFDTVVFIASLVSFLIFNLPITESDNVPQNWFTIIYYTTLGVSSVLGSSLIVVVIMLYNTISSMIRTIGLNESILIHAEEDEDDENNER
ncbi:hypothetical protein [Tenacibaculum sp. IB213877]|uniref:hypothetical protein n=1 Tax=Tenacibaculum sp. IB213877 TaxID=3097351 RepID=UPI002A5A3D47|nr:hypothetical protein [Tenacibaculum sp. IB213877]MDY0779334.1 hypothetical protein [Tenacibaculum sp. IB213877]